MFSVVVSFVRTLLDLGLTCWKQHVYILSLSPHFILMYQLSEAPSSILVLLKFSTLNYYLFQAAHISLCSIKGASVCLWFGWSWPTGD
jgi:hypothetical protein